jgi:choline dehydrogenase-like flavoprotein
MLLSKSERHPKGLANSSGLVGKNLMFHPYAMVTGLFEEGFAPTYQGPLGNILISQEFYETNSRRDFVRGYSYQMCRSTGPAKTAAGLSIPPVQWGEGHHEEFRERFGRSSLLAVIGEDLPEEHNRVELDPKLKDSNGIPAPKIFYKLSQNSRKQLDHAIRNAERVLKAAGAHKVIANPLLRGGGWHLMGTARMGNNPKRSVVDRNGQAHDADNLFIVDGSVFVTGAAVNPTPTIQALALRTADYICEKRGDLKG